MVILLYMIVGNGGGNVCLKTEEEENNTHKKKIKMNDDGAASLAEISQSLDRMRQQTRVVEELTRDSQKKDEHIAKLLQENARIRAELAAAGIKMKESSLAAEARIRELEEREIRSEERNRQMDEENRKVSSDLQAMMERCEGELVQCREERDAALRRAEDAEAAVLQKTSRISGQGTADLLDNTRKKLACRAWPVQGIRLLGL